MVKEGESINIMGSKASPQHVKLQFVSHCCSSSHAADEASQKPTAENKNMVTRTSAITLKIFMIYIVSHIWLFSMFIQ